MLAPTIGETTITPQDELKYDKNKYASCRLLQHPAWKQSRTILVEWEGMEKQENR